MPDPTTSDTTMNQIGMSDKLALSAALSVLMMTAYVLFGGNTPQASFAPADFAPQVSISATALPALQVVLAQAGTRRILY